MLASKKRDITSQINSDEILAGARIAPVICDVSNTERERKWDIWSHCT